MTVLVVVVVVPVVPALVVVIVGRLVLVGLVGSRRAAVVACPEGVVVHLAWEAYDKTVKLSWVFVTMRQSRRHVRSYRGTA